MSAKLSLRLRKSNYESNIFLIGIKIKAGWVQRKMKLEKPTYNQNDIFNLCRTYLNMFDKNIGIYQIQVTALNPNEKNRQNDFFNQNNKDNSILDRALDKINDRFGQDTVKPARLKSEDTDSPDVIAPAWRPVGFRKSV